MKTALLILALSSRMAFASATCSMNFTEDKQPDGYLCRNVIGDSEFTWSFKNAGLQESDVLVSIDGIKLDSAEAMGHFMRKLADHTFNEVIVRRDQQILALHPDPKGPAHYN
jgi:hypothetical protein